MPHYAMAVDIGGTFTDVVLRDEGGRTWVDKTLTTPQRLDNGFFTAVDAVLKKADVAPAAVTDVLVHATTVVTNAVIERKGPLTALLVTEGFRDILTIRDEHRYEMFECTRARWCDRHREGHCPISIEATVSHREPHILSALWLRLVGIIKGRRKHSSPCDCSSAK